MDLSTGVVGIVAYLCTGIALTGYDFSAPATHRKRYVTHQRYGIAVVTWFIWPLSTLGDVYQELRFGTRGFRLFTGVILLAGGMSLWGRLCYLVIKMIVDPAWLAAALTVIPLILTSPGPGNATASVMPSPCLSGSSQVAMAGRHKPLNESPFDCGA